MTDSPPPPPIQRPAPDHRHLDRALARGIVWTAALKWFTQVLSWLSTIIIARILAPNDYGLMGMATVYIGLVQLVNEAGLGAAIVQRRHLTREQIARLGGLSILLGVAFAALSVSLSGLVAGFFDQPDVRWLVIALSTTFVTTAFQVLPRSLMQRDLRYPRLAAIEGVEAIAVTIGTLAFAFAGFGYWALALGNIGGRLLSTVVAVAWYPHPVAWPRQLKTLAGEIAFGSHIVLSRIAWYVYNNADTVVVGRVLGQAALGAYSMAWTMASVPVDRVSALVARVTPGIFATVQRELDVLRRYLLLLTEGIALVTFPLAAGLALVADLFVPVVLGEQWRGAVVPLQLLALYGGFRSIATLPPQVLVAVGHSRRSMQFSIVAAIVLPLAFLVGSRWGTVGVALGWIIGYPLVALTLFFRASLRAIGLPAREYARSLWPAAVSTGLMAAAVAAVRQFAVPEGTMADPIRLAALVATGVVTYAAVVWWRYRDRVTAFLAVWRRRS